MAWCHQATSHCRSQCWPRSTSPYGVTDVQQYLMRSVSPFQFWFPQLSIKTIAHRMHKLSFEFGSFALIPISASWHLSLRSFKMSAHSATANFLGELIHTDFMAWYAIHHYEICWAAKIKGTFQYKLILVNRITGKPCKKTVSHHKNQEPSINQNKT